MYVAGFAGGESQLAEVGLESAHRCSLDLPEGTKGVAFRDKGEREPGATDGEERVAAGVGLRWVGAPGEGTGARLMFILLGK